MGTQETLNRYLVALQGDRVAVVALIDQRTMSRVILTREQAIMFAAWLLLMADMVEASGVASRTEEVTGIVHEVSQAMAAIEAP